jgi:hypothetical protein
MPATNTDDSVRTIIEASSLYQFQRKSGVELEVVLTDDEGIPVPSSDVINRNGWEHELRDSNIELGTIAEILCSDVLSRTELQIDCFFKAIQSMEIQSVRLHPYSGACLRDRKSDLSVEIISSNKPRYTELWNTWKAENPDGVFFLGEKFESIGVLSSFCATQFHLSVKPDEVARALNFASAIAAPALAPFVSGGRLFGQDRGVSCVRPYVWRGLFRGRTGVSLRNEWATSLEEHLRYLGGFPQYLTTNNGNKLKGAGLAKKLKDYGLLTGTLWPDVRLKWFVVDEQIQFTIEARHQGASTIRDNMAGFSFWIGLMINLMNRFDNEEFCSKFGSHHLVESNFMAVAKDGLEADIMWFGEPRKIRQLIENELLDRAKEGLVSCGIDPDEAERYLNPIAGTIQKNQTLAEWIRTGAQSLEKRGLNSLQVDELLMKKILQNGAFPVCEWERL